MPRHGDALKCSFCHKSEEVVAKLISSPNDHPRAYICDECISVCASILADENALSVAFDPEQDPHPLLYHPLASEFMASVERWITQESLGVNAAEQLAEVRGVAIRMLGK